MELCHLFLLWFLIVKYTLVPSAFSDHWQVENKHKTKVRTLQCLSPGLGIEWHTHAARGNHSLCIWWFYGSGNGNDDRYPAVVAAMEITVLVTERAWLYPWHFWSGCSCYYARLVSLCIFFSALFNNNVSTPPYWFCQWPNIFAIVPFMIQLAQIDCLWLRPLLGKNSWIRELDSNHQAECQGKSRYVILAV